MDTAEYLNRNLEQLLGDIAARTPEPGGGSVAAIATAMAAGLAAMSARFSTDDWDEARGAIAQAESLRERSLPLAQADAEAYAEAIALLRRPKGDDPEERDRALGEALSRAAAVPLEIAGAAADVALLSAEIAERGNPNLRGDAAAAAILAEAAARMAANLVVINLSMTEEDERVARALSLADAAAKASRRAVAAGP
jgi:formiminotetrahydrofolate cyclodeaminase